MALEDDLGMDSGAAPKASAKSNLEADLGGGTDWSNSDGNTDSTDKGNTPVTDEAINSALNFLRGIPRHVIQAAGGIASNFGNNSTPEFNINGSEGSGAGALYEGSRRTADALEGAVPNLQPVNQSSLDRIAGQGFEMGLTGLGGGPESVVPAVASGAISQGVKEAGGGPLAQTVGALSPFAPAAGAAALRGVVRGGAEGAQAMEGSVNASREAGLPTSLGAASGNPLVQGIENVSSRLPGSDALKNVRAVNPNVEASVNDIIKSIKPDYDTNPATASKAGTEIKQGAKATIQKGEEETSKAKLDMDEAVGGKDHPVAGPLLDKELQAVLHPTGDPAIDAAVTGAKTRAAAGTIKKVTAEPTAPKAYTTDGEGYHNVKSDNGESHAREMANGDLQVFRDDTAPEAQGRGEATGRLELLAHAATGKGGSLVSDMSVSPGEAGAFEALGRRGWKVEKNPNAEVNPATGNLISDSPKNPVYKVSAPNSKTVSGAPNVGSAERQLTGGWSYDPKTGKSEPNVSEPQNMGPDKQNEAQLDEKTPWTFETLRAMRTNIGQQIGRAIGSQKTQLQRLYGAMSEDLKNFAASKGPDAEQKYEFFNSVASQNAGQKKALLKAIKEEGGTGELFNKAMRGSSEDAGRLSRVMGAMNEDGRNTFRSVVLHRMGRAGGAQEAPFQADTFLRNYDKMSPEAKTVLFGDGQSAKLRKSLDDLNKALTDMKQTGRLKSNLGQTISSSVPHGVGPVAGIIGGAIAIKEVIHPLIGMAETHPIAAVGAGIGAAGMVGINPIMSRVLTNPKVINWFTQTTRLPAKAIPGAVAQLRSMGAKDPDAKSLADWMDGKTGGANSTSQVQSAPNNGSPADGTDFTNPGKTTKIHTPAGDIQGVDPSTFGSRFNNPKANPKSLPPDLPAQASDYTPAS